MARNVKQFRDMGRASFAARLDSAVAKDKALAKANKRAEILSRK